MSWGQGDDGCHVKSILVSMCLRQILHVGRQRSGRYSNVAITSQRVSNIAAQLARATLCRVTLTCLRGFAWHSRHWQAGGSGTSLRGSPDLQIVAKGKPQPYHIRGVGVGLRHMNRLLCREVARLGFVRPRPGAVVRALPPGTVVARKFWAAQEP